MSKLTRGPYASFDEFYAALDADRHISERLSEFPELGHQVKDSLRKLYARVQEDEEFERKLAESPQATALAFIQAEMANYTLSDDELEAVAGGKPTTDTSLGYDIGYVVGSTVEWIGDLFD